MTIENTPEDQFMDYAVGEEEGPIQGPENFMKSKPDAKYLQTGINEFNKAVSNRTGNEYKPLEVDGDFGPKTKKAAKDMILGLPPEMKRWANARLKKSLDGGAPIRMPEGMGEEEASSFLQNMDFENMDIG